MENQAAEPSLQRKNLPLKEIFNGKQQSKKMQNVIPKQAEITLHVFNININGEQR